MEHGFIDRYGNLDSCVHRLDARVKILSAFSFIILAVTTPPKHLLAFVIYAGLLLWTVALSRVPLWHIVSRAAIVIPFSAFVALGLPLLEGKETVNFSGLDLSVPGLWLLAGAVMKASLGVAALVLLVSTTPFNRLLEGLRQLKVPSLFIDLLALTYRYVFILADQAMRLRRAAQARGFRPRWLPQAAVIGRQTGHLFVRSYNRAERIYGAMRLRGYNGSMPAGPSTALSGKNVLVLTLAVATLVFVRLFAK